MKVKLSRRYILLMAFIVVLAAIYSGGLATAASMRQQQPGRVFADSSRIYRRIGQQILERSIVYQHPAGIDALDFSLTATGKSQFELRFRNPYTQPVQVKVYSIIGNLISSEEVPGRFSFSKTYNFSEDRLRLFVVEVGNRKYNLAKKITTI